MQGQTNLCCLPSETLHQILGHVDAHRPSIYAFALASKACYQSASPFLFRHIHLTVRSPDDLARNVDALSRALSRADAARYVSRLTVEGFLDTGRPRVEQGKWHDVDPMGWWKATWPKEPRVMDALLPNTEPIYSGEYMTYDEAVIKRSSTEDLSWAPLAELLRTLPSLANLVYDCPNQLPPSLLDAMHAHPRCVLDHRKFKLRTLLWGTPYPYEMTLATSPRLRAVRVYCTLHDSDGDDDFNHEAARDLAAGLAPGLDEVTVVHFRPGRSGRYWRRAKWEGLPGRDETRLGSLSSLSLFGTLDLQGPSVLRAWAAAIDFGCLRRLTLGDVEVGCDWSPRMRGVTGETMSWMDHCCALDSLEALCLVLQRDEAPENRAEYGANAVGFLGSLPLLRELSLTGPIEPGMLDVVLDRHGPTLETLRLYPLERDLTTMDPAVILRREIPLVLLQDHVRRIRVGCPRLAELAMPLHRMQTPCNAFEVGVARRLAEMESLTSLFLILDCSDGRVPRDPDYAPDASFDDDDLTPWSQMRVRRGHIRRALAKSAVDERVARHIWGWVALRKKGRPLDSLRLWTTGGGSFGNGRPPVAPGLFTTLSRSWLIKRVKDDERGRAILDVRELGRATREANEARHLEDELRGKRARRRASWFRMIRTATADEWQADRERYEQPPPELTEADLDADPAGEDPLGAAMAIFRRVWPAREGSGGWREDWRGLVCKCGPRCGEGDVDVDCSAYSRE